MKTKILKIFNKNKGYKIFLFQTVYFDYIHYARYYSYNFKQKRIVGNWKGLGWFTSMSHAIRSLRRSFKRDKLVIVK
jgi:hypothetical protein